MKTQNKTLIQFKESNPLAAQALGCEPCRIAKTLSFMVNEKPILIVAAGNAKIDNAKYKQQFATKAKMLSPDEVIAATGHAVGGVCPFALPAGVQVWLDISLRRFTTVYPACGSSNSAIPLDCDTLGRISSACGWVDVCRGWENDQ